MLRQLTPAGCTRSKRSAGGETWQPEPVWANNACITHLEVLAVEDRLQVLAIHVSTHAVLLSHLELSEAVLQTRALGFDEPQTAHLDAKDVTQDYSVSDMPNAP